MSQAEYLLFIWTFGKQQQILFSVIPYHLQELLVCLCNSEADIADTGLHVVNVVYKPSPALAHAYAFFTYFPQELMLFNSCAFWPWQLCQSTGRILTRHSLAILAAISWALHSIIWQPTCLCKIQSQSEQNAFACLCPLYYCNCLQCNNVLEEMTEIDKFDGRWPVL